MGTQAVSGTRKVAGAIGVIVGLLVLVILLSMVLDSLRKMPDVSKNPECPHTYATELALPGALTGIPEYHDCQRLINLDDETYGPLAGVFVRKSLDTLFIQTVNLPVVAGTTGGTAIVPGTVVTPIRFVPTAAQDPLVRASAIAIAEIQAWDSAYTPLGISPGFNCLYVTKVTVTGVPGYKYAALMIPVTGSDDSVCLPRGAPAQGGTWLKVVYTSPATGEAPFPAVARWDWDGTHRKNYVSMLCGTDWCEVGDDDLTPVPTRDVTAGTLDDQIQWEQKGRYDEQRLAMLKSDGKLYPTGVLATASPHSRLADYTEASFEDWQPVARTALPADLPIYTQKFNFGMGNIPGVVNEVSLCTSRRFGGCIPFLDALKSIANIPCWKSEDGKIWWAKVVSSTGTTAYRCTSRRIHGMEKVPAAARWRWKMNDEGLWVRCGAGCCEVYGDE